MSAVLAVARLEARRCVGFLPLPLVAAALPVLPWMFQGDWRFATTWLPDLVVGAFLPLCAAGIGGDAVASQREDGSWSFTRSRAIGWPELLGTMVAVRALAFATVFLLSAGVVRAWRGEGAAWLEQLDVTPSQGWALALLLGGTSLIVAFFAGLKLPDSLAAMMAGLIGGAVLTGVLLLPGLVSGGSLRAALSGPSERAAARAAEDVRTPPQWTSPDGRVGAAQLPDRVVLIAHDLGERRLALPGGTTTAGRFVGGELVVRFGDVERLVDVDGRTRPVPVTP